MDPLALRFAFLDHRYRQQLNLTWAVLEAADRTVRRWRERVAEWARSPSKPMCAEYVTNFNEAFDDDLDTPAALRVLRNLEKDSEIPPGAKFETFAHADHLLGLDLARDIGREPAPRPLPDDAADLLEERAAARAAADWPLADRLRDRLGTLGVTVTDTPAKARPGPSAPAERSSFIAAQGRPHTLRVALLWPPRTSAFPSRSPARLRRPAR